MLLLCKAQTASLGPLMARGLLGSILLCNALAWTESILDKAGCLTVETELHLQPQHWVGALRTAH